MILKKLNENNTIKCIYESSNIMASHYNTLNGELIIIFKNGSKYTYSGVPKTDYLMFEMAESQGKVLNTTIKQYSAVKGDPVDVDIYVNELAEMKLIDKKNLELGMIDKMRTIISEFDGVGSVSIQNMETLLLLFNKYKN